MKKFNTGQAATVKRTIDLWWKSSPWAKLIEIPNALALLWWWRMLTLDCDILSTNPSFSVIEQYATRQVWAFWFGSICIYAVIAVLSGPPVMRAIGLVGGAWVWALISLHLSQASPWCDGYPMNTGTGIYAILSGMCGVGLYLNLLAILPNIYDAWNKLRQKKRANGQIT